ncbi:MAG TPA: small ribosomal subunit Rsm22 family protein [Aestuariivirga sp.]|nr:small ribosomal subunit Rsm22 family protein [Aestuariivirga sp.]
MNAIPPDLKAAIDRYLAENEARSLVEKTARMSERYRQGRGSDSALDFGAYLVARLPATYAAVTFCLAELAGRRPQFSPRMLLDAGSGPGTAAWAATRAYSGISTVTFLDNNLPFLKLASSLAAQSDHAALQGARVLNADLGNLPGEASADLVIAAYALAEMPLTKAKDTAIALWKACEDTLVVIEPGTPQGFARIHEVRGALLAEGAHLIAPCTHENSCPIQPPDWCHFSVRLARRREHMHAKRAKVPFEDEKFSYLIAARQPDALQGARILSPPAESKADIKFKLCSGNGLTQHSIARRDKAEYKRVRKLEWGGLF